MWINYTISGKDYYRCAGVKERGTCNNRFSVRQAPIEEAVLSILQDHLLTAPLAELFVKEYRRQAQTRSRDAEARTSTTARKLAAVNDRLEVLARNMTVSEASPTLHRFLAELEQEKASLEAASATNATAPWLPSHDELLALYRAKVSNLRTALNDSKVSTQASQALAQLIHAVTIYPGEAAEAEVSGDIARLIAFAAANENSPRLSREGCSITVVAGVGFEPTTFRL